jgi:hypothetical protein
MIAICSENQTKHINIFCRNNAALLNARHLAYILTVVLRRVKIGLGPFFPNHELFNEFKIRNLRLWLRD